MKNENVTIIYHSADYDGIFSGQAVNAWLGHQASMEGRTERAPKLIGWDYGQPVPNVDPESKIFMVDIAIPELLVPANRHRIVWIDHHKTSMDTYGEGWPGVRIEGVAACRLVWAWFLSNERRERLPTKQDFIDRTVDEPKLLRLAGEYDVWDHRNPEALTLQYGLRAQPWFSPLIYLQICVKKLEKELNREVADLFDAGRAAESYAKEINKTLAKAAYRMDLWSYKFLVLNATSGNSTLYNSVVTDKDEGLLLWGYNGTDVKVSLYAGPAGKDIDFSQIAKRYGGGGHRGACGFRVSLETWFDLTKGRNFTITKP